MLGLHEAAIMVHVLDTINHLSNLLQSTNRGMEKTVDSIETRSDPASFDALRDKVKRNSAAHGLDTTECRMCTSPKKWRFSIKLQDLVVADYTGKQSRRKHYDYSAKYSTRIKFMKTSRNLVALNP